VHRRTVRQALASAVPLPRKAYPPRPPAAIDRYAGLIDGWLLADREVPRKQRHGPGGSGSGWSPSTAPRWRR